jgi:hypothetical protein
VKPGDTERATVANAAAQNLPGVGKIIAIFPNHLRHFAKVLGFFLTQAKWDGRFQPGLPVSLNLVGGHSTNGIRRASMGPLKFVFPRRLSAQQWRQIPPTIQSPPFASAKYGSRRD